VIPKVEIASYPNLRQKAVKRGDTKQQGEKPGKKGRNWPLGVNISVAPVTKGSEKEGYEKMRDMTQGAARTPISLMA